MPEDITIQQLRSLLEAQGPKPTPEIWPARAPGAGPVEGPSFADTLKESILEVNQIKIEADQAVTRLATGESTDLQGTVLALQKADVSFRLMMEVRNKMVSAYQEIMRTGV